MQSLNSKSPSPLSSPLRRGEGEGEGFGIWISFDIWILKFGIVFKMLKAGKGVYEDLYQ